MPLDATPFEITKPTLIQLRAAWMQDELPGASFELVHEETAPDDHGYQFTYIFKRESDGSFWSVSGVVQGGGDYHQLRELECSEPTQVFPHQRTITEYTRYP